MSSRGMPITKHIKAERRKRAEAMKAEYDKLTTQQKLDRLPKDGAKKQRERLTKLLSKSTETVSEVSEVSTTDSAPETLVETPTKKSKKTKKSA